MYALPKWMWRLIVRPQLSARSSEVLDRDLILKFFVNQIDFKSTWKLTFIFGSGRRWPFINLFWLCVNRYLIDFSSERHSYWFWINIYSTRIGTSNRSCDVIPTFPALTADRFKNTNQIWLLEIDYFSRFSSSWRRNKRSRGTGGRGRGEEEESEEERYKEKRKQTKTMKTKKKMKKMKRMNEFVNAEEYLFPFCKFILYVWFSF